VFANYTAERISTVFETLNIGKTKQIDLVAKMGKNGVAYNSAYVHFEEWYDTIAARNFQSKVIDTTKEAKLVYEEPWYWVVLENKAQKFIPGQRKPCIVIDAPSVTTTPDKRPAAVIPNAPVKASQQPRASITMPSLNLNSMLNAEAAFSETEEAVQMEEVELAIEEEAQQRLDSYIQFLEDENNILIQENNQMRQEIEMLQQAYNNAQAGWSAEAVKTRALADAIQMIHKVKQN